jgi:hypothetical protein
MKRIKGHGAQIECWLGRQQIDKLLPVIWHEFAPGIGINQKIVFSHFVQLGRYKKRLPKKVSKSPLCSKNKISMRLPEHRIFVANSLEMIEIGADEDSGLHGLSLNPGRRTSGLRRPVAERHEMSLRHSGFFRADVPLTLPKEFPASA